MAQKKQSPRVAIVALAVLAFIALGLSVPILVGGRTQSITLQSASVQAASRDTFTVTTPVRLLASPTVTLQSGSLAIAPDKSGRPRSGEAVSAILSSGSARIILDKATITLDLEREGKTPNAGPIDANELAAPLLAALTKLSFENLSLRNCIIVLKRGDQTSDVLSDVRIELSNKRNVSLTAVGSFDLAGRQLALDATLGLTSDKKDVVQLPLKASLKGGLIDASIADARLLLGAKFEIIASQADVQIGGLTQAAAWLGAIWSNERGLGTFKAKGQMRWVDRTIVFQNAAFQMDRNEATGTLAYSWGQVRPEIEGTLALKRLDLTQYMGLTPTDNRAAIPGSSLFASWLNLWAPSSSLAMPIIRQLDADIRISADRLTAGPWSFGKSAASLSVKGGKMLADVGELEMDNDGSARGQLTIDMNAAHPRYVMRGKIEGFDAAKSSNQAFGHPVLTGRANLVFDLTASAPTIDQFARNLSGRVGLELPDGGAVGLDLPQLAAIAQRSPDPGVKGWGTAVRGQTRVDHFAARVVVSTGKLAVESFKAIDSAKQFTAVGGIDLVNQTLVGEFSIRKRIPAVTTPVGILDDTSAQPTEVISINGSWNEPTVRYSTRPSKSAAPNPASPGTSPVTPAPGVPVITRTPG